MQNKNSPAPESTTETIGEISHKNCPASFALALIANKWSVKILYTLALAPETNLRFREIQRRLSPITQRELTKHLRAFEESGLVTRAVYAEVPPRVEYALTPLGQSLCETVGALSVWAEKHGAEIQKNREDFAREKAKTAA